MADRSALPDWPELMSVDMAAAYFSVSPNTFRSFGISAIERGRRVLYDRHDLDRYADRLSGQPLTASDRERVAVDIEREFFERRRRA